MDLFDQHFIKNVNYFQIIFLDFTIRGSNKIISLALKRFYINTSHVDPHTRLAWT